jgi:TetR/AcrR family transcriptional regulator, mexCD-oprJ operon repressor
VRGHGLQPVAVDRLAPELPRAPRPIRRLVDRGRREGAFRTDLPADWLVTTCFALLHACGDQVRAGAMSSAEALDVLTRTMRDLFVARS